MAHPTFYNDLHSASSGRNYIDLTWVSLVSGGVPTTLTTFNGVTSVTHGSTGVYTVTFDSAWNALLGFMGFVKQASYVSTGACNIEVTGDSISVAGTRTITLLVTNSSGTATDPTTGDKLYMTFVAQSENVNAGG